MIGMWVDGPKPFPAREHRPGASFLQVWPADNMPVKHPTAEQIARELYAALQKNCAGQWLLAQCIEGVIFPAVCRELSWPMRSWKGKDGVAAHLARLLPPPEYKRTEIEGGEVRKLLHYRMPRPDAAVVELAEEKRRRA
jgi:hypothetical protein